MGKRKQQKELTLESAQRLHDSAERKFAIAAIEAGLEVKTGPSIRCKQPVEDKTGRKRKTVTQPDFTIVDPSDPKSPLHVEVTNGKCTSPSKQAQRRVVEQARVDNYVQLSGDAVEELASAETPQSKRTFLSKLFSRK